ncbi:MAG: restriction endonuclease subunit S [Acinetobacter sp.]|jgi:type I restriction enzyme S subunit
MVAPKLRFKEFDGDWVKKTLGEVVKFSNGKRIPLSESERQKRQGDYRYYGASSVIDYIDDYLFNGEYILIGEDGANIIARSSTLAFVVTGKFWVNNHAHIFQSKDGNNIFLATYLESLNFEKFNSGTAQPKLNLENLKKVPVADPSLQEQKKIATFLSAVDEKIAQLSQKLHLLGQYKQGMMQKLFSQQIRFKADDGREFGEWEYKPLNEIAYKNSIKNKDGNITEVLTNSALQGVIKQSDYFDREIVTEANLHGYYLVNINDFVYNPRISVHAPVGPIKRNKKCLGVMSPLYTIFTVEIGNLTYLEYFFDSNFWHDYVKSVANSGARHDRMNITNKDFFEMPVLYPCLEEQTKIANFLSAIDQKMDVVSEQLTQAKTWKKGLLQQMFV